MTLRDELPALEEAAGICGDGEEILHPALIALALYAAAVAYSS